MEEQLVSFETAKLAKKKGFNIIPKYGNEASLFDKTGNHTMYANYGFMYSGLNDGYISAPTQSLLQKFIREKRGVHIDVSYLDDVYGYYFKTTLLLKNEESENSIGYSRYEDALEAGLQEVLKLI